MKAFSKKIKLLLSLRKKPFLIFSDVNGKKIRDCVLFSKNANFLKNLDCRVLNNFHKVT